MSTNIIASLQEGEEWISRLEKEKMQLEADLLAAEGTLSGVGIMMLAFGLAKTEEAIEQIKLEMMMLYE